MKQYFKKGLFDRYDGWRVKNVDAVFAIIPFILRTRIDSQVLFEENIPIDKIEAFIRAHKEDMPDLSLMQVIMAAIIRLISQRPYLNRFIMWNKIYARNHINISLAIKRPESGEETLIKPDFEPDCTLYDVVRIVSDQLAQNKAEGKKNTADKTSAAFGKMPSFLVRTAVFLMYKLDNIGLLPKSLHNTSPWHCSVFLTNVGSLGIGPIYHHLYEFGTCSIFIAMGNKTRVHTLSDGSDSIIQKYIGLKFVNDERICDGQYYARSMKLLRRILAEPEGLLVPPENVLVDDGVNKPRLDTAVK